MGLPEPGHRQAGHPAGGDPYLKMQLQEAQVPLAARELGGAEEDGGEGVPGEQGAEREAGGAGDREG